MSALNFIHGVRECFRRGFHHSISHLFAGCLFVVTGLGMVFNLRVTDSTVNPLSDSSARHTSVTHTQTHTVQTDSNACIQAELR